MSRYRDGSTTIRHSPVRSLCTWAVGAMLTTFCHLKPVSLAVWLVPAASEVHLSGTKSLGMTVRVMIGEWVNGFNVVY